MTQCKDCKSDLKPNATKCSVCGSYQDWKGYVNSTQLLLGFVLVLLTVQPVKDLVLGTGPRIEASVLTADTEQMWVVVSNSGKGPAALVSIGVTAHKMEGNWEQVLSFEGIQDRLLKPDEIKIIPIRHEGKVPEIVGPGVVTDKKRDDCNLVVHYYEIGGVHVSTGNRFRCYVERAQKVPR